jgi:hypothetical protein
MVLQGPGEQRGAKIRPAGPPLFNEPPAAFEMLDDAMLKDIA